VISGLLHGDEHVAELDHVPAPAAIANQNLPFAVHQDLLGPQVVRHIRLKDPIAVRLPVQFLEPNATADDGPLVPLCLDNDRRALRARILRREDQRLRQVIGLPGRVRGENE
jgi:hypothetical protein